jgi:prepilin signal peptidase PulO-like enzyme (type II secretory pathway)
MALSPLQAAMVSPVQWWLAGSLFVFGACIGSFLNVVIYRLPAGLSLVAPPSRCPQCQTPIRAFDNVPIVSWLILRGRCRACGVGIPVRYPIIELFTAVVYARIGWKVNTAADGMETDLFGSLWQSLAKSGWPLLVALVAASCLIVVTCWCVDRVKASSGFLGVVAGLVIATSLVSPDALPRLADVGFGAAAGLIVGCLCDAIRRPLGSPWTNRVGLLLPNAISVGILVAALNEGWVNACLLLFGTGAACLYVAVGRIANYQIRHAPLTIWAVISTVAAGLRANPLQAIDESPLSIRFVVLTMIAFMSLLTWVLVPRQSLNPLSDV